MPATAGALLTRHRLSVQDYYRMAEVGILGEEDRVELIRGEIIDRAPIGPAHASAVKRISNLIKEQAGRRAIVATQDPIPIDGFSVDLSGLFL